MQDYWADYQRRRWMRAERAFVNAAGRRAVAPAEPARVAGAEELGSEVQPRSAARSCGQFGWRAVDEWGGWAWRSRPDGGRSGAKKRSLRSRERREQPRSEVANRLRMDSIPTG
jgi:hypothetical protein